jgi:segregation and condensation protein B
MKDSLESKIEALLFWKSEPLSRRRLTEILKADRAAVDEALETLKSKLSNGGIVLQEKDDEVMLGTAPEFSDLIEHLQKEELSRELSKASLETLSIVLYKNGASRADIDFIRGVNSSFILRALSVRGLVERVTDPDDSRRYVYRPSFELLSYMGLGSVSDLPEYKEVAQILSGAAEAMRESSNMETEEKNINIADEEE